MHHEYRALYIHIPFCASRCAYCDFVTSAVKRDSPEIDRYIEELVGEIRRQGKAGELTGIQTVYIGGGTPSFVGGGRLTSLLYALSCSLDMSRVTEFTLEANPESLDEALVKDVWALGVNRLSLGVQSFNNDELAMLARPHDADCAKRALSAAHVRFENVSIDLMCGLPLQTSESFRQSLETGVAQGVTHMSIYPLTIEPKTPFEKMVRKGKISLPDQDTEAEEMEQAEEYLTGVGFARYEVASYARPGFASRHNIAYWTGVPYLGIGRSAATMTQDDNRRMRVTDGQVTDDLNRPQMIAEDLMLAMRMARGVAKEQVITAREVLPGVDDCFVRLTDRGLIEERDGCFRPTRQGWLCGNELYGEIFDLP